MITIKSPTEFNEIIKEDNVIVEFFAEWCTPCKMLDMIISQIEEENNEYKFVKVDTDRFRSIAKEYKILSVPVIKVFRNGKDERTKQGLMSKDELISFIEE